VLKREGGGKGERGFEKERVKEESWEKREEKEVKK